MIWIQRRGSRGDCRHLSPYPGTVRGRRRAAESLLTHRAGSPPGAQGYVGRRVPLNPAGGTVVARYPALGIGSSPSTEGGHKWPESRPRASTRLTRPAISWVMGTRRL